jgi:antimicrobial peptide system SdpA family protein
MTSHAGPPWTDYRPTALFVQVAVSACVAAVVVAYAVHGSMTMTALELPLERHLDTVLFLPEGWAFFTRDPKEPEFLMFHPRSDGSWTRAARPNDSLSTVFGFSRFLRSLNVERGLLVAPFREGDWRPCTSRPELCLADWQGTIFTVKNRTPGATVCGPVAFVKQDRVPWAWSRSVDADRMPSRVLRMEARCDQP